MRDITQGAMDGNQWHTLCGLRSVGWGVAASRTALLLLIQESFTTHTKSSYMRSMIDNTCLLDVSYNVINVGWHRGTT